MGYAIGIDIGTANTRVAIYRDGKIEVIPDKDGERSMPSYVAFTERCPLFGNAAKARAASNPRNTVYGTKRILGQHLKQWLVGRYTRISPNDVSIESPRKMTISVSYRKHPHSLSLLQVFGMLLRRARANAETHLGEIVQDAVISVPVHFNKLQRLCVYDAALSAGINVQRIDSSIESIALYCAFITPGEGDTLNICVLDFGAGFFNVGLVGIYEKVVEVLSVASDKDLGGEDLIDRVYNHFATAIQEKWNWVINMDICARHRLRAASVAAMKELSSTASTRVYIDSLYGGQDFDQRLSRQTLEQKCEDLFHAMLTPIEKSLREAVVNKSSVQEIVMAGGCSRIPKVQEVLADSFDSKPLVRVVNPNESEVIGSALHAAILSQRPDQTVDDLTLLSSEPFDIGLGIGGKMSTISPRNTTIPSSKLREYRLCDLGLVLRERPVLHFYQGHERRVKDNYFIGTLDLSELLSGRDHGVSETNISIKVSIDADQNVFASAFVNPEGRWTSTEAWKSAVQSNGDKIRALLWQVEDYRMDEVREEEIAEKRHALYLRLASLGDIELPSFQTNRMRGLLGSLGPLRDRLDGLEFESFDEHEEFDKALDTVERDLKNEVLRGKEIMGLRSHAEELRAKLLATIQTPKTGALLRSIGGVTRWVDQNEEAAIQDYQAKLRSLTAISLELTTLSEASSGRDSTPSVASPQRSENSTSTQMDRPRSLEELFHGSNADPKSKFTDAEFEDIASYLRNTNHQSWSKVPRVYTVLRLIGQVELVDAFLQHDMSDIWFPFSDNTLPRVLKQPRRAQFLNAQEAVFSKALELEKGTRFDDQKSHRKHAHFSQSEPLPFEVKGNSGSGAHGIVDKVVSTLSYKEYARKRFKRSAINKKYVKSFLN